MYIAKVSYDFFSFTKFRCKNALFFNPGYLETTKNDHYDLTTCLDSCYYRKFMDICKCKPFYLVESHDYESLDLEECSFVDINLCAFDLNKLKKQITREKCNCPYPCHKTEFHTTFLDFENEYTETKIKQ